LDQLSSSADVQRTLFKHLVKDALSGSVKSNSARGKFCPRATEWIVTIAMAKIVAIGASQGGVAALVRLVRGLPTDFPAAILIAQHVGASPSVLPSILDELGRLPARHAQDRDVIEPQRIFIAPPDHHMLVVDGELHLTRGPRENWARPAIDPLFRTAAEAYGPDATAVVLTGRLNDGTAGLYEVKRRGGITVVQDPADAEVGQMPAAALENVDVDYCLPIAEIPELLTRLARSEARPVTHQPIGAEIMSQMETPVALSCPECSGAMREEQLANLTTFRCHIGHAMSAEIMAAAQSELIEQHISMLFRILKERALLCAKMAAKLRGGGNGDAAALWKKAGEESASREAGFRALLELEWTHPEGRNVGG